MASNRVAVKTLGSGMGAATTVVVGINPKLKKRQSHLLQNMQEAKNKANEIMSTAQKTAAVQSEEMIREATQQAATIKTKAEKDIAMEKAKAVNEIKDEIGSMAMEIAGKAIGRELREEDHEQLINEFIANVGEGS